MNANDQAISLTRFIDFVVKSGSPKLTSVRDTKKQLLEGYSPATDFYKQLREAMVAMHRDGDPIFRLEQFVEGMEDGDRRQNFIICTNGYKKFFGPRRKFQWFEPPRAEWDHGRIVVRVNPELGLVIDDVPHVIKLHFKPDEPNRRELNTILHLMRTAFELESVENVYAVLDVRRGKLFCESKYDPSLTFLLKGEGESFATIFDQI